MLRSFFVAAGLCCASLVIIAQDTPKPSSLIPVYGIRAVRADEKSNTTLTGRLIVNTTDVQVIDPSIPSIQLAETIHGDPDTFINVTATTNGSQVRWFSSSPALKVVAGELLRDSRTTQVIAARDGFYTLVAYTALNDTPSTPATTVVVVGKPRPEPLPPGPTPPGPTPPPTPAPDDPTKYDVLFFLSVDSVANRTATESKLLDATSTLWKGIESRGHHYLSVDTSSDTAKRFQPYWSGSTASLIIQDDKSGRIIHHGKLPGTEAEILDLEKKYARPKAAAVSH